MRIEKLDFSWRDPNATKGGWETTGRMEGGGHCEPYEIHMENPYGKAMEISHCHGVFQMDSRHACSLVLGFGPMARLWHLAKRSAVAMERYGKSMEISYSLSQSIRKIHRNKLSMETFNGKNMELFKDLEAFHGEIIYELMSEGYTPK